MSTCCTVDLGPISASKSSQHGFPSGVPLGFPSLFPPVPRLEHLLNRRPGADISKQVLQSRLGGNSIGVIAGIYYLPSMYGRAVRVSAACAPGPGRRGTTPRRGSRASGPRTSEGACPKARGCRLRGRRIDDTLKTPPPTQPPRNKAARPPGLLVLMSSCSSWSIMCMCMCMRVCAPIIFAPTALLRLHCTAAFKKTRNTNTNTNTKTYIYNAAATVGGFLV